MSLLKKKYQCSVHIGVIKIKMIQLLYKTASNPGQQVLINVYIDEGGKPWFLAENIIDVFPYDIRQLDPETTLDFGGGDNLFLDTSALFNVISAAENITRGGIQFHEWISGTVVPIITQTYFHIAIQQRVPLSAFVENIIKRDNIVTEFLSASTTTTLRRTTTTHHTKYRLEVFHTGLDDGIYKYRCCTSSRLNKKSLQRKGETLVYTTYVSDRSAARKKFSSLIPHVQLSFSKLTSTCTPSQLAPLLDSLNL